MIIEFLLLGPYVPDTVASILKDCRKKFPYNRHGKVVDEIKNRLVIVDESEIVELVKSNPYRLYAYNKGMTKDETIVAGACKGNSAGFAVCTLKKLDNSRKWVFGEECGYETIKPMPTHLIDGEVNLYE